MARSFPVPTLPLALVACCALAPGVARAQAPAATEGPSAQQGAEAAPAPDEIRVRAESYEQVGQGRYEARGTVDLRVNGMRVLADKADVFEETRAGAQTARRVVAEGNVVFIRGAERLSADRAELDESGKGVFLNAVGYVEPGVFVEARRVERVDDDTYRVFGGTFSSCSQPNPRWNFTASRATIDVDRRIQAVHSLFKVKGVPILYLPYVYYPISKDGRATGLLMPRVGYSSFRGFELGAGFFWAMGRSADQTFSFDHYSRLGYGFGHDLRWSAATPSRGALRTYVFNLRPVEPAPGSPPPAGSSALDYDIDWNVLQTLPGRARAALNVRRFSDLLFQRRIQTSFDLASTRSEHWSASIDRDFPFAVVSAYVDSNNTYFQQRDFDSGEFYTTTRVSGRVPGISLRRFPRQIGWGGVVFGLTASADRYRYGNQDSLDPAAPPPASWERYDVGPTLSRPLRVSFLDFNPSVGWRYTRYSASNAANEDGTAGIFGPPIERRYFETSLEMRGPVFSRVFDAPGSAYSERFKHTIGPEVTWTYRTRVDRFPDIPKSPFGDDYQLGTDEIRYALVQRFFAKRRGPTGKLQPYEFFSWRLMQTYYVRINEGQDNFDPNYSSSAFGPGFRPEHLSPVLSRMRLQPSPSVRFGYDVEYDVNFEQIRRTSANVNVSRPGLTLTANWSRALRQAVDPAERFVGSEWLRAGTTADVWPRRLTLEGSADYDLHRKVLQQARVQLRYSVQCCGLVVEHIRYNLGGSTPDTQQIDQRWRFSLELANVGSIGMGTDPVAARQGLGGYR